MSLIESLVIHKPFFDWPRKSARKWLRERYLIKMLVWVRLHPISLIIFKKLLVLLADVVSGGYSELSKVAARLLCALMRVCVLNSQP